MNKEKVKWYINRLKSMKAKEVIWRIEQKGLESKEKRKFKSSGIQIIDNVFNSELNDLKNNFDYKKLGLNFENEIYSISNNIWLFDNYNYDDIKYSWNYDLIHLIIGQILFLMI